MALMQQVQSSSCGGVRGFRPFVPATHSPRLAGSLSTPRRPRRCRHDSRIGSAPEVPAPLEQALGSALVQGVPPQVLVGGAAAVAVAIGLAVWSSANANKQQAGDTGTWNPPDAMPLSDAVLVFGATGKLGRLVVAQLVKMGRSVVAATRDAQRARETFAALGLKEGRQSGGGGVLAIQGGVDVTNAATLTPQLFQGVVQVVQTVGPVFGKMPDGKMGYVGGMTSERVDAEGTRNVVAALTSAVGEQAEREVREVVGVRSEGEAARWERLDDVIMGGRSSSSLLAEGGHGVWRGELILEGGGFCGTRLRGSFDFGGFDGVALRVRGDGQTLKLNLKTAQQAGDSDNTYQAVFDTVPGDWTTQYIAWREFVAVKRARVDPEAPPLDPSQVAEIGLVLSRFAFNGLPNLRFRPGPFELAIENISGFRAARPALVLVSSAGVERNARIGDDAAARKADIPIVQLNPGGILNFKYAGEMALRASGLPYSVIRPTGLTTEDEGAPYALEAAQGDRIAGRITRAEVASVVASSLSLPEAAGKTLEVRRSEAADGRGVTPGAADLERLFLNAVQDRHRLRAGLPLMPAAVPPPPPVSEARKEEILEDPRVRGAQARERQAAPPSAPSANGAPPAQAAAGASEAQQWIQNWRERPQAGGSGGNGAAGGNGTEESVGESQPVLEARKWIEDWRARSPEQNPSTEARAEQKV